MENLGASVKSKGGKKSGYNHRTNWNTIDENGFRFKDNILIKGIIAKASQFPEYKKALMSTNNSLLIHPKGGNPRSGIYEYATMHMYVRQLLNGEIEHINYDKTTIASDIQKSEEVKSIVDVVDSESISASQLKSVVRQTESHQSVKTVMKKLKEKELPENKLKKEKELREQAEEKKELLTTGCYEKKN